MLPRRRSSRRREQDSSIASIPELPLGGESEGDQTLPPTISIFDPLWSDSEAPSTSSLSQSSVGSKKSETTKKVKNKRLAKLSVVAEDDGAEVREPASSTSFTSERSVLSSIDSNSVVEPTKKKGPQKKAKPAAVARIDEEGESAASGLANRENKDNPENQNSDGKRKKAKTDSAEQLNAATPGIASRLRRRRNPEAQVEGQKENTPPARKGEPMKPVGTQVNGRMLSRATKKPTKKTASDAGEPIPSPTNPKEEILKAPRKSRSREPRSSGLEGSHSSNYPRSSSPLELISPIPTETESNGPQRNNQNNTNNTMDDIPSISSDQHQPSPIQAAVNRSVRRSISIEIERNSTTSTGQNVRPVDGNEGSAISISEPVSSTSSSNSSRNQQPTSEHLVINCKTAVSIKLSSKVLNSGGEITIEPSEDSKFNNSALNKTKSGPKLSFGTLSKLGGRHRRFTSWSSDSESDCQRSRCSSTESKDTSGSTSGSDSDSDSTTGSDSDSGSTTGSVSDSGSTTGSDSDSGSTTGSESDSSSTTGSESEIQPCDMSHSKKICRKCHECDYCCVCRR